MALVLLLILKLSYLLYNLASPSHDLEKHKFT